MSTVFAIGPFRLDASAGTLLYGDAPTPLGRRGVTVLQVLVEHAPEFVTKPALLDLAWPGVIVEDSNLATQISAIRRTLAQTPGGEAWIETLARRGYRFVGPVAELSSRSGSTRKVQRPPPGATHEWLRRHVAYLHTRVVALPTVDGTRLGAQITETIRRFGGQLETSKATSWDAVFGLEAVDNAPDHAALAALEIHRACARLGAAAVVAIDADHHPVRPQEGRFQIAEQPKAALCAGLDDMAVAGRPGATVVSARVLAFLRRRFAFERLDEARPTLWLLLPSEPMAAALTPYSGRAAELGRLVDASVLAAGGQAQVAGIVGDAGIGKSRLVRELVLQLQGWLVLAGGCAPYTVKTPYHPLAQTLKRFCGLLDSDRADEVRHKVAVAMPAEAGDPRGLLPALYDVLGVLPADDDLRAVDPALRRRRTHDALRQFFLAVGLARPLCLVVEDLQWIDVESREVLDSLVNGAAHARLLLLVTSRPESPHLWGHKACYRHVHLDALPAAQALAMLDALLGDDPGLASLKQRLAAQGNPFYIEETARELIETQALQGVPGHYRLTRPQPAPEVPATVQAILAARIDRLAPDDRRLLQVASIIGKDVPFVLLQAVADLAEEPLRRGLEALQAAEFLHQTELHPHLSFAFKHALTYEVTYASLMQESRRTLHARIVGVVERLYADRLGGHLDRLAHHAMQGERWESAVGYLWQAGSQALARAANLEAVAYFEQALMALAQLPESRLSLEQGIDLRFALRTALVPLGELERMLAVLHQAQQMAEGLADRRRRGEACAYRCHALWMAGRLDEACAAGQEAQDIADALGDAPLQVLGSLQYGAACLWRGDYPRGEACLLRVLDLPERDPGRQRLGLAGAAAVSARAYLSQIHTWQGRFDEGIVHGEHGIRLAEALDRPFDLANVRLCLTTLHNARGAFGRALALLEHPSLSKGEWGRTIFAARIAGSRGYAQARLGRIADGIALLEQALSASEGMRYGLVQLYTLLDLGEAYVLGGRVDDARACARRAQDLAAAGGRRGCEVCALHLQGMALAQHDDPAPAEDCFRRALLLATELGMAPLVAHGHLGLGRLHRRLGRLETAQAQFDTAGAMYLRMGMDYWLDQVNRDCAPGTAAAPACAATGTRPRASRFRAPGPGA